MKTALLGPQYETPEKAHTERARVRNVESPTSCSSAHQQHAETKDSPAAMREVKKQMSTNTDRQAKDNNHMDTSEHWTGPARFPAISV